jgi:Spy/CpxP family protein refolding chaperone
MRRSSAVAGVVALFLVGVVVGALGAELVSRRPARGGAGGPLGAHLGAGGHRMMAAELRRRLDLTAEQQRQLDAILADTHRETQALWQEVRPRVLAVIERGQNRIAQILTPRQRQEFEVYRRERAEHLRRMLDEHLPRPPGTNSH